MNSVRSAGQSPARRAISCSARASSRSRWTGSTSPRPPARRHGVQGRARVAELPRLAVRRRLRAHAHPAGMRAAAIGMTGSAR